jgi:stress response protein SCP2
MPHVIEFAQSFVDNIRRFVPPAETEMAEVVRGLEEDPRFMPDARDYDFDKDAKGYCLCRHKSHWDDWRMYWYPETRFNQHHITIHVGLDQTTDAVVTIALTPRGNVSW